MLPLWIIDLTRPSDRQTHFQSLLRQVSGVYSQETSSQETSPMWFYTTYEDIFVDTSKDDIENIAGLVYRFQEQLVKDGQEFIQMLRRSNINPSITLNVCVLGDATESLTQMIFPSIAVMLQKEKGRIVSNHIHQGLSIVGSLYIPADINSRHVEIRQSVLLTLQEIEVQHNIRSIRGYDRMFIYQNVQNRTENYYPQLDAKGEAEYLIQCLIHLYYACDSIHPLISGSTSNDSFYFSLGVASCFFDTKVQDRIDNATVTNHLINTLNKKGDLEEVDELNQFIQFDKIEVSEIIQYFQDVSFDLKKAKLDLPKPHPIADFLSRRLKRLYYNHYLKYYPANLRLKVLEVIASESELVLESISAERRKIQKCFVEMTLPAALEKQISSSNQHTGIITRIQENLKSLKTRLGKMKGDIAIHIEQDVWHHLMQHNVPKNLHDNFEEYHEAFSTDTSKQGRSMQCEEMKQAAQDDLINHIKQEPTFLGRLGRSFLLGIVMVLCIMPFLSMLSPSLIDLGDIKKNAFFWSAGLFILPLLFQFISLFLYYRKKGTKERKLTAYYLHDAYARIANRIQAEAELLYDNLMKLSDEYNQRCERIQHDIQPISLSNLYAQIGLPTTRFNQPIVGGSFGGKNIIPAEEDECREIYVSRIPRLINELDQDDGHQLLHSYKDEVMGLFSNVSIPEKHPRRFDPEKGYDVFISKEELEQAKSEQWNSEKNQFIQKIMEQVEKDFLPRLYPTIDEKIYAYARKKKNNTLLFPIFQQAATNGELTSSADPEIADIKSNNERVGNYFTDFLPDARTQYQFDSHQELFGRFLFITRWRTFEKFSLNRILPSEDFDMTIRDRLVNEEERNLHKNASSSLILWSMCKDDKSTEWMKLFDGTELTAHISNRDIIRKQLNQKD